MHGLAGRGAMSDSLNNKDNMQKKTLRQHYANLLKEAFPCVSLLAPSMAVLFNSEQSFMGASLLAGFIPIKHEPGILPILSEHLASGRRLLLPVFDKDKGEYAMAQVRALDGKWLETGNYGIREPLHSMPKRQPPFAFNEKALWLVPGVAFALDGMRLGRGGGYYDRLLQGTDAIKIGVAFNCQIGDSLPSQPHDIHMDYLLTETRIINCKEHRKA